MMTTLRFLKPKAAPLACGWAVNVAFIQLNILDWVAKSELVNTHASSSVSVNLNDGQGIN